jgi:hypothetical protein
MTVGGDGVGVAGMVVDVAVEVGRDVEVRGGVVPAAGRMAVGERAGVRSWESDGEGV